MKAVRREPYERTSGEYKGKKRHAVSGCAWDIVDFRK